MNVKVIAAVRTFLDAETFLEGELETDQRYLMPNSELRIMLREKNSNKDTHSLTIKIQGVKHGKIPSSSSIH